MDNGHTPAAERSTYVLLSSLILLLMFWQWQSLPGMVWNITQPALATILWITFGLGWLIVLVSTFLVNHFNLFGLRQVYLHFTGQPYTPIPFQTPWLYRVVRQGQKVKMGVGQQFDTTDFHVEAIDLLSNHVPCEAGIALVVAVYSVIKRQSVLAGLVPWRSEHSRKHQGRPHAR